MKQERKAWRESIPKGRAWRATDEHEAKFFQHLQEAQRSLEDAYKAGQEFESKNHRTIKGRRASSALRQVRRARGLIANQGWLTPLFDLNDPDLSTAPPDPKTGKRTEPPAPPKAGKKKSKRRIRRDRKKKALRESKRRSGPRTRKEVSHAAA